jgi:hypothetical protein
MNYTVTLKWNGAVCLSGTCTAACGIETARGFINRNFNGLDSAHHIALFDESSPLERLLHSGFVAIDYADETGRASAVVKRNHA